MALITVLQSPDTQLVPTALPVERAVLHAENASVERMPSSADRAVDPHAVPHVWTIEANASLGSVASLALPAVYVE